MARHAPGYFSQSIRAGTGALSESPYQLPVSRDQVSLVGWKEVGQPTWVLSGSSNYEDGLPLGSPVREYGIDQPRPLDRFGPQPHTTGPMALGDVDGDGTLELFVGAKILPGQWPLARFQCHLPP